jgi:radical SAM protein with 4Fe4S-binding SPASM domain
MALSTFQKLIQEIHSSVSVVQFFFQGEPFLNPLLPQFIQIASRHNLYSVISTNGHFLTPTLIEQLIRNQLDHLIISVDGLTQKTYEQYRVRGNLTTVIEGIQELVKRRGKRLRPLVELQFIVFKHNEHELPSVIPFARELKVDKVTIKSAQVYHDHERWLPENAMYRRYRKNGTLKKEVPNRCWKMWHSFEVTWDGNILPCCFDKNGEYAFGNILENGFHAIWYGNRYQQFRSRLLLERASIPMCSNCSEGL